MTSDDIRTAFLSFFEKKGHKIVPSSSLIPHGDPTLLLTSAGMVQFKPYFLGEASPPSPRLASCQKCFRTTDVDLVGDPGHLTFFEMLGNFSIGDYFKKEAISWAWEFVTERLNLPPQRLWISIYTDDDESCRIWQEIGVPEKRILRFGKEHNFWGPAGDFGPCGPCSEIHYDFGEELGCGKASCRPNCDCGRFSEIWNLVFTQYNQDKNGVRTPLPMPNIDTGMGLERITAVVQGKKSVYETDVFFPLLERLSRLTGKKYEAGNSSGNFMRIIAEHSRGIAFLIADGVTPSNDGRGYVLRRLLRRAALFGRMLGLDKSFLPETAVVAIDQMGHIYPEIVKRRDFILKVIGLEETRFEETLSTGLELLDGIMGETAVRARNKISGAEAFKLYDTYGFPVELTAEIAAGKGMAIDLEGFDKEMKKQKERAKATHKFELAESKAGINGKLNIRETPFVGYHSLEHKASVVDILVDGRSTTSVVKGQEADVILDTTPFYGEMGGQIGDAGEIRSSSGHFLVTSTVRIPPDIIVHRGHAINGSLTVGDEVEARVDSEKRLDIARNHTATHLLQAALRQVLGDHIQQRGSLVAPDKLRFDFSHLVAVTEEELRKVQSIVNSNIRQNLKVCDEQLPYDVAISDGATALFDEKYGDVVRVMKIGEPVISAELCGGTHVTSTGELGYFHVISESSVGSGLRRIEAVTGRGAEAFVNQRISTLERITKSLGALPENVEEKLAGTIAELEKEHKLVLDLERELSRQDAETLIKQAEMVNGVNMVVSKVQPVRSQVLREMSDLIRDRIKSVVVVLGTVYDNKPGFLVAVTPDLVNKGYNAGEIVKKIAAVTGGGGGGKAELAQAGGKYKDKLEEALRLAKKLI